MPRRTRSHVTLLGAITVTVALALAGCDDDSPQAKPEPSSSTTTPPTTAATVPPTTFPPDQADALRGAVTDYEEAQGTDHIRFEVRNLLLASADPSWARFNVGPSRGNEAVFQGGYGVAHLDGTQWDVVDFGTADVGCPPVEVPVAVRQSLQLGCPPG